MPMFQVVSDGRSYVPPTQKQQTQKDMGILYLRCLFSHSETTVFRPICPQQKRQGFDDLFGFVREDPPRLVVQDEFECLNLIVTCPDVSRRMRPLPVMVWIHG